jgi:5,10-methylenetetrahydromethanopterin reductase
VLIGTTGPRALQAAGRVADGILLPEGSVPEAIRWAREQAGNPRRTVVYAWLSLDDDRSAAAAALRPMLDGWLQLGLYPSLRERAGLVAESGADLEDDRLRALAVAGDARDCARAIAELWAAGADPIVLLPRSDARDEQLARFNAEVRPLL